MKQKEGSASHHSFIQNTFTQCLCYVHMYCYNVVAKPSGYSGENVEISNTYMVTV